MTKVLLQSIIGIDSKFGDNRDAKALVNTKQATELATTKKEKGPKILPKCLLCIDNVERL